MIKPRSSSASRARKWFAGSTVFVILASYLAASIAGSDNVGLAAFVLLFQIPYLVPAAIYYLRVSGPQAVWVCGILLVALTTPPWIFYVFNAEAWRLAGRLAIYAFILTSISSSVGAVLSRNQLDRASAA